MIRFNCDYSEGAHPKILERLAATNFEQTPGYGEDEHCKNAARLICEACAAPGVFVRVLTGGTQLNLTVIAAALRPHQGVITADTGHINVHESGAIEATGHKVLPLGALNGKLSGSDVRRIHAAHLADPTRIHTVQPKMVYVSLPTELGTMYSKAELDDISVACRECGLFLFLDGARLGYGLTAPGSDLTLPDIARMTDAFSIGGTKVGALFGEALIVTRPELRDDLEYIIKQRGGMLAKGRLLGIQFEVLFEDGLYWRMGEHANKAAALIREACEDKGFAFVSPSPTNQQFPILPDALLRALASRYTWDAVGKPDAAHTAVRFCTSWATKMEDAEALAKDIRAWKS